MDCHSEYSIYINLSGSQSDIMFLLKETHSVSELRWGVSLYHLEVVLDSWVAILYCMQRVNFEDLG